MDIIIKNLTKKFGGQVAVDNISFEIKKGEILGFLGPNGAGKTTTMKMICQYLEKDGGEILFENTSIDQKDFRDKIGYLPENNPLYQDMPVLDYLGFCAKLQGIPRNEIKDRIADMVKLCGLNAEKHKKINELSKGFRQRVGLAQAIIHDPEVLILDEPTSGLDPNQIVEIRDLIRKIGKEKTVILSTHILPEVEAVSDRILIINEGKIVADGTAEKLRKESLGLMVYQLCIEEDVKDELVQKTNQLKGVKEVKLLPNEFTKIEITAETDKPLNKLLYEMCVENHWTLLELIPFETKLEDVFRDLTLN